MTLGDSIGDQGDDMSDMEYRRLGDSGLVVSVVGLGANNFGRWIGIDDTRVVVDAAIDAGITLIDTADVYGDSELLLGEVLEGRRDQVVLATKFGGDLRGANGTDWGARGSRRYIRKAVVRSLTRLRTDYIDLYQIHQPDALTPIEETLSALDDLVREGLVRYVGSSNFTGWQVADADWTAVSNQTTRFISAQNHYSLAERGAEAELSGACERFGVGILPYFPLANGLLTGKYARGADAPAGTRLADRPEYFTDERMSLLDRLNDFAKARGVGVLDVAISGLAAQPAVGSVIAGATKPEQVQANAAALSWQPTDEDLTELDTIAPTSRRARR